MTSQETIQNILQLINTSSFEEAKSVAFEFLDSFDTKIDSETLFIVYDKLGIIMYNLSEYQSAIEFFSKAIELQNELGNKKDIANVYLGIGSVYSILSDNEKAMDYCTKALQICEEIDYKDGIAQSISNIGIFYDTIGDYDKALEFYFKALSHYEEIDHKEGKAKALGNIGSVYNSSRKFDISIEYSQKALALFEEIGNSLYLARAKNNIGSSYSNLKKYDKAFESILEALSLYEKVGNKLGVVIATLNLGMMYSNKENSYYNKNLAEEYLFKGLAIANEIGSKEDMKVVYYALHNLRLNENRFEEALNYYKKSIEFEKEIHNEETKNKAQFFEQRRKIEEDEKARQLKLARFQEQEKILLNILPIKIADRILQQETFIADYFESASVLFFDIVNFTTLSSLIPPKQLVYFLDTIFTKTDEIIESFGLEKIKTIGDGYLAVANVTTPVENHQKATANAALQLLETMKNFTVIFPSELGETDRIHNINDIEIRIGIHTGEVVAGIIGKNKYTYDLWGDAVNVASRMESNSEAGRIHISSEFAKSIKQFPEFKIIPRGEISIKGKGLMKTFWLEKAR
ncbi:MAG: tetratricopeptide repeat protein [Candidatus Kapabacteria bacterium]|nr:tetratricopeptide repeat protein [Candidatus Kapabacteria bacterium]